MNDTLITVYLVSLLVSAAVGTIALSHNLKVDRNNRRVSNGRVTYGTIAAGVVVIILPVFNTMLVVGAIANTLINLLATPLIKKENSDG